MWLLLCCRGANTGGGCGIYIVDLNGLHMRWYVLYVACRIGQFITSLLNEMNSFLGRARHKQSILRAAEDSSRPTGSDYTTYIIYLHVPAFIYRQLFIYFMCDTLIWIPSPKQITDDSSIRLMIHQYHWWVITTHQLDWWLINQIDESSVMSDESSGSLGVIVKLDESSTLINGIHD